MLKNNNEKTECANVKWSPFVAREARPCPERSYICRSGERERARARGAQDPPGKMNMQPPEGRCVECAFYFSKNLSIHLATVGEFFKIIFFFVNPPPPPAVTRLRARCRKYNDNNDNKNAPSLIRGDVFSPDICQIYMTPVRSR